MKLRKVIATAGVIYIAYNIGKLAGGLRCLKSIVEQYGNIDLKDANKVICKMGRHSSIVVADFTEKAK